LTEDPTPREYPHSKTRQGIYNEKLKTIRKSNDEKKTKRNIMRKWRKEKEIS
jgi:hypothetical protein